MYFHKKPGLPQWKVCVLTTIFSYKNKFKIKPSKMTNETACEFNGNIPFREEYRGNCVQVRVKLCNCNIFF